VVDRGVTPELAEQYGEMAQFPLMGQAIVMAYNLPTFNTSDPSLVLLLLSSFQSSSHDQPPPWPAVRPGDRPRYAGGDLGRRDHDVE
jgi:hypothetical protein